MASTSSPNAYAVSRSTTPTRRRVSASKSSLLIARWKRLAGMARVGFGGRADAAVRRLAHLLDRSRRATLRTGTR